MECFKGIMYKYALRLQNTWTLLVGWLVNWKVMKGHVRLTAHPHNLWSTAGGSRAAHRRAPWGKQGADRHQALSTLHLCMQKNPLNELLISRRSYLSGRVTDGTVKTPFLEASCSLRRKVAKINPDGLLAAYCI